MKRGMILMILLATLCSCARLSRPARPGSELADKRQEIDVLQAEIAILVGNFDRLQQQIENLGLAYPPEMRERDLGRSVKILHDAREALSAQLKRIHREYGIGPGIL